MKSPKVRGTIKTLHATMVKSPHQWDHRLMHFRVPLCWLMECLPARRVPYLHISNTQILFFSLFTTAIKKAEKIIWAPWMWIFSERRQCGRGNIRSLGVNGVHRVCQCGCNLIFNKATKRSKPILG